MAGSIGMVNYCKLHNSLSTCRLKQSNFVDVASRKASTCSGRAKQHSLKGVCKWNSHFLGEGIRQRLPLPRFVRSTTRIRLHIKSEKSGDALLATGEEGNSFGKLLEHARSGDSIERIWRVDGFVRDIATLALPAIITQAIEPMAQLMETAYVGRIVGVAVSIFNLVSKVFNVPLLSVTTSFVAEDDALVAPLSLMEEEDAAPSVIPCQGIKNDHTLLQSEKKDGLQVPSMKRVVPAVSSSLFLALMLAVVEAAVLALGVGPILTLMGVPVVSPMRCPAAKYLAIRALGAPANVISLAVQGIFRGLKDTRTPLYATVASNICNIVLGPILIFTLGFGVTGAAIAMIASQYFMAFLLLWNLSKQVVIVSPKLSTLRMDRFLKSGGFLLGRTMAVLFTMTLATSMAARQGPISMAGHQILMQIWLASSLLSDALALAGQAIMANAFAKGDLKQVKQVAFGVLQMGLSFGLFLALVLSIGLGPFSILFTKDSAVQGVLASGILFVAGTQPLNALAFVFDGIHYGVSDFEYAAYSMIVVGLLSSICLLVAPSFLGLPGVWLGLTVLMTLRVAAGVLRLGSATGPWQFLRRPL